MQETKQIKTEGAAKFEVAYKDRIDKEAKQAFDMVIDDLVIQEKNRRKEILYKAYLKEKELIEKINNLKPDSEQYVVEQADGSGVISDKKWKKQTWDERQKLIKQRNDLDDTMQEVLKNHSEEAYKNLEKKLK